MEKGPLLGRQGEFWDLHVEKMLCAISSASQGLGMLCEA